MTESFFPDTHLQQIIRATDGVLVEYRGQEAYFHCETPTMDGLSGFSAEIQGVARILIGPTSAFPDVEENELITVSGDDYLVGGWRHPEDGGIILIALKRSTRF